jgi:hypothetical protein
MLQGIRFFCTASRWYGKRPCDHTVWLETSINQNHTSTEPYCVECPSCWRAIHVHVVLLQLQPIARQSIQSWGVEIRVAIAGGVIAEVYPGQREASAVCEEEEVGGGGGEEGTETR